MKLRPTFTAVVALAISAAAFQSCSKKDRPNPPAAGTALMTADFQAGFSNSRVQYFIDDWPVFDRALTTPQESGLAYSQPIGLQSGKHRFRVVVDGIQVKDTAIELNGNTYLGVNNVAGDLRIMTSTERWTYE